jgi:PAS domain S-box-containing protein
MASQAGIGGRLLAALPTGRTLPEEVWLRRHKALLTVLWLHALGLTIFASLRGYNLLHSLGHGAPLVLLACMAMAAKGNRRAAAAFVSLGLISSSALLVHSWDGVIEGHFHFFVMIALLTLYEDWFPFLLAAAYVVLHHGVMGAIDPGGVYNHPDAAAHPWKWALIHGGFVVAAGTASVVTWRLNENVRAETQSAYRQARESEERFKSAFSDAPIGMVLESIEPASAGRFLQVNTAMCEITGYSEEQLVGMHFTDITHPDDVEESMALEVQLLSGELSSYEFTKRYLAAGGDVVWAQVHVSVVRDSNGEPAYAIGQVQDVTERELAQESIRESSRQLAEAQKLAQLGSWQWTLETGEVSWSEELFRIFGLDPERDAPSYSNFFAQVHPDERSKVEAIVEQSLVKREPFHEEMQIKRADGTVRIIDTHGKVILRRDGSPAKMVGTAQDVTDRRFVERKLALQEEADKEHRARSDFLSRISHELRTPLNSILGFAQLLEMDDLDETQRENVGLIIKGGNHLLQLINEVLEISRIEAGTMTISLEPVDAGASIAEVVNLLEPLAAQHGVTLQNNVPQDGGCHVQADSQRLKQVLLNLGSNAIKYNKQGGSVRISLEMPTPERTLIMVTDTGHGISEENQAKLFTPFDRLGADQTQIEGTGLGLALSKLLTEAMGGTLAVESEPWVGSTFSVGLAVAAAPTGALDADQVAPAGTTNGAAGQTETVLYVEDNRSNLRLVERIVAKRPHVRLLAAMNGALGLQLAQQHRPALILLDLHLPGMDGEDVLRQLKADPLTARIPVMVISADATKSRVERLLAGGAEVFLTKPLDVDRFMGLLDAMLQQQVTV